MLSDCQHYQHHSHHLHHQHHQYHMQHHHHQHHQHQLYQQHPHSSQSEQPPPPPPPQGLGLGGRGPDLGSGGAPLQEAYFPAYPPTHDPASRRLPSARGASEGSSAACGATPHDGYSSGGAPSLSGYGSAPDVSGLSAGPSAGGAPSVRSWNPEAPAFVPGYLRNAAPIAPQQRQAQSSTQPDSGSTRHSPEPPASPPPMMAAKPAAPKTMARLSKKTCDFFKENGITPEHNHEEGVVLREQSLNSITVLSVMTDDEVAELQELLNQSGGAAVPASRARDLRDAARERIAGARPRPARNQQAREPDAASRDSGATPAAPCGRCTSTASVTSIPSMTAQGGGTPHQEQGRDREPGRSQPYPSPRPRVDPEDSARSDLSSTLSRIRPALKRKTKLCTNYARQCCGRPANACDFAHGEEDRRAWLVLCQNSLPHGKCRWGNNCRYPHSEEELLWKEAASRGCGASSDCSFSQPSPSSGISCDICGQTLARGVTLDEHVAEAPPRAHDWCVTCGVPLPSGGVPALELHRRGRPHQQALQRRYRPGTVTRAEGRPGAAPSPPSTEGERQGPTPTPLCASEREHAAGSRCGLCWKRFACEDDLLDHQNEEHAECKTCRKRLRWQIDGIEHMQSQEHISAWRVERCRQDSRSSSPGGPPPTTVPAASAAAPPRPGGAAAASDPASVFAAVKEVFSTMGFCALNNVPRGVSARLRGWRCVCDFQCGGLCLFASRHGSDFQVAGLGGREAPVVLLRCAHCMGKCSAHYDQNTCDRVNAMSLELTKEPAVTRQMATEDIRVAPRRAETLHREDYHVETAVAALWRRGGSAQLRQLEEDTMWRSEQIQLHYPGNYNGFLERNTSVFSTSRPSSSAGAVLVTLRCAVTPRSLAHTSLPAAAVGREGFGSELRAPGAPPDPWRAWSPVGDPGTGAAWSSAAGAGSAHASAAGSSSAARGGAAAGPCAPDETDGWGQTREHTASVLPEADLEDRVKLAVQGNWRESMTRIAQAYRNLFQEDIKDAAAAAGFRDPVDLVKDVAAKSKITYRGAETREGTHAAARAGCDIWTMPDLAKRFKEWIYDFFQDSPSTIPLGTLNQALPTHFRAAMLMRPLPDADQLDALRSALQQVEKLSVQKEGGVYVVKTKTTLTKAGRRAQGAPLAAGGRGGAAPDWLAQERDGTPCVSGVIKFWNKSDNSGSVARNGASGTAHCTTAPSFGRMMKPGFRVAVSSGCADAKEVVVVPLTLGPHNIQNWIPCALSKAWYSTDSDSTRDDPCALVDLIVARCGGMDHEAIFRGIIAEDCNFEQLQDLPPGSQLQVLLSPADTGPGRRRHGRVCLWNWDRDWEQHRAPPHGHQQGWHRRHWHSGW